MKHSEVGRKNDLGYMFGLMFSGSWCWFFCLFMIASFTWYNFEITKASFFLHCVTFESFQNDQTFRKIINLRTSSFQVVPAIRSPGSWLMSSEEDPKSWTRSLGHLIRWTTVAPSRTMVSGESGLGKRNSLENGSNFSSGMDWNLRKLVY